MLATGKTMNVKWVIDGAAETGAYCNLQGTFNVYTPVAKMISLSLAVLRQMGAIGVALTTLVSSELVEWLSRSTPRFEDDRCTNLSCHMAD
jgi:hypothetical protein